MNTIVQCPPIDAFLRELGRESYNYSQYIQGIRPCFMMALKRMMEGNPGWLDALNAEIPSAEKAYCEGEFDHLHFSLSVLTEPGEETPDFGLSVVSVMEDSVLLGVIYLKNTLRGKQIVLTPGSFCSKLYPRKEVNLNAEQCC